MTHWGTTEVVRREDTGRQLLADSINTTVFDLPVEPLERNQDQRPEITRGIREQYQKCKFYDMFVVGCGSRFPAHQVAIAALSSVLRDKLMDMIKQRQETDGAAGALELHVEDASTPEVLRILLDFTYGFSSECTASSDETNLEVLRMARRFEIPGLIAPAAKRLAEGVTTANIAKRLKTCRDFGLDDLFDNMSNVLVSQPEALAEFASEAHEADKDPEILQSLLVRAVSQHKQKPERAQQKQTFPAKVVHEIQSRKTNKRRCSAAGGA